MDPSQFDEALDAALGTEPEVDLSLLVAPKTPINVPPMPSPSQKTFDKRMLVSIGAFVIVVLGCSGLYAVWQKSQKTRPVAETSIIPPPSAKRQSDSRADFTPKPVIPAGTKQASAPPVSTSKDPAPGQVIPLSPSQGASGLLVAATEATWVEVTMNGKTVFMGLLEPGQSQDLRNAETARILVGNAGGVAMRWNGKDIGPIGPKGQVRRVIFSKESYEIQLPGKPASD